MFENILKFLAGIGVFLFSVKLLSKSMESLFGGSIRKILNNISKSKIKNIGIGAFLVSTLQSTTASIALTCGFLNAQLISLFQGLAIVMGIHLASSLPMFLISFSTFNITKVFSAFIVVGVIFVLFFKNKKIKKIGDAIIALSLLFIGLDIMSDATAVLKTNATFINLFTTIQSPLLLCLIGLAFTLLIQSALATFAILSTLVGTASVLGIIPVESAVYLLYGSNLGTAITTAIFIGINNGKNSKRICVFHVFYVVVSLCIITILSFFDWISIFNFISQPAIRLAFLNLIFNLTTFIVLFPFLNQLKNLFKKIFRNKKNKDLVILDEFPDSDAIAMAMLKEAVSKKYNDIMHRVKDIYTHLTTDKPEIKLIQDKIEEDKIGIESLKKFILKFTLPTDAEHKTIENYNLIINQLDKVVNNCINILSVNYNNNKKTTFDKKQKSYIEKMFKQVELSEMQCLPYINDLENKEVSSLYKEIQKNSLIKETSEITLKAKMFIVNSSYATKYSIQKNTAFLFTINNLELIVSNFVDILIALDSESNDKKYEQLKLDIVEN